MDKIFDRATKKSEPKCTCRIGELSTTVITIRTVIILKSKSYGLLIIIIRVTALSNDHELARAAPMRSRVRNVKHL